MKPSAMKQPNRENSRGVKPTHSDDDWLVAYENHVVLGGPAPGDFPEGLSDQEKQELSDARRAIDALHGVFSRDRAAAEPATTEPPLHQLGDFQILHEIGRGGMGVVYEARHRVICCLMLSASSGSPISGWRGSRPTRA